MKKFILSLLFLAGLAGAMAQFSAAPEAPAAPKERLVGLDQVVAVVEDATITQEDLLRAMTPFVAQIREQSPNKAAFDKKITELQQNVLQGLVDKVIIVKEFHSKGYSIPQSRLDADFEDELKRNFNGDRSEFQKFLQSQNKTMKQFRKDLEERTILWNMQHLQRMTASEVSPVKIQEYYEENKQQWHTPATVKISIIKISGADAENLKSRIAEIHKEIAEGLDFAEAAKKYSQDTMSSKKGGEWGWYSKGQLNPLLDNLAFALDAGKFSEPVFISDSAYILKVDEKKTEGIQPIDEVRAQIEFVISSENARIEYEKWLDRLRKKSYIRYY